MRYLYTAITTNITLIVYLIVAFIIGINDRTHNDIWAQMPGVQLYYDLFAIAMIVFCITVGIGLLFKKEWGRVFCIGLNCLVIFILIVLRLLAPFYFMYKFDGYEVDIFDLINVEVIFVSLFAIINIIILMLADKHFKSNKAAQQ